MANLLELVKTKGSAGAVDDGPILMTHIVPEARLREHDVVRLMKQMILSIRRSIYQVVE